MPFHPSHKPDLQRNERSLFKNHGFMASSTPFKNSRRDVVVAAGQRTFSQIVYTSDLAPRASYQTDARGIIFHIVSKVVHLYVGQESAITRAGLTSTIECCARFDSKWSGSLSAPPPASMNACTCAQLRMSPPLSLSPSPLSSRLQACRIDLASDRLVSSTFRPAAGCNDHCIASMSV